MSLNDTINSPTSDQRQRLGMADNLDHHRSLTIEPTTTTYGDRLLNVKELAAFLGVSVTAVYRLVEGRKIRFFKLPRGLRFHKNDVEAFLNRNRVEVVE